MAMDSPLIDTGSLAGRLGQVLVLDCRFDLFDADKGRRDYLAGHIPGAVYVHLEDELAVPAGEHSGRHPLPSPQQASDAFRRLGVRGEQAVVCYDDVGGAVAARAWWMLSWLGHEQALLLDGGLKAWQAAGGRLETGNASPSPGDFHGRPRPDSVVSTADIESGAAFPLLDARARERYLGRTEPIDPVAGHIPGAVNAPFSETLDEQGCFRDADWLQRWFAGKTGEQGGERFAAMCGSGVTACHLAVAARVAGLPMPRIYVGSWSEWIRDPGRAVAEGPPA